MGPCPGASQILAVAAVALGLGHRNWNWRLGWGQPTPCSSRLEFLLIGALKQCFTAHLVLAASFCVLEGAQYSLGCILGWTSAYSMWTAPCRQALASRVSKSEVGIGEAEGGVLGSRSRLVFRASSTYSVTTVLTMGALRVMD